MTKILLLLFILFSNNIFAQCEHSISIEVNGNECPNSDFFLVAHIKGFKNNPTYLWKLNGIIIDGTRLNSSTPPFSSRHQYKNGDTITCIVTSNDSCDFSKTYTDTHKIYYYTENNYIKLSVHPSGTITSGTPVKFTAIVKGLLASKYHYQYFLNGKEAPSTYFSSPNYRSSGDLYKDINRNMVVNDSISIFYDNNIFRNSDSVYLTLTNAVLRVNPCNISNASNIITMSVRPTLPYIISHLNVRSTHRKIILDWATTKEINTNHFNIQTSTDDIIFNTVKRINAAGNSINIKRYRDSILPNTSYKTYYVRLQVTEKDGSITYSPTEQTDLYEFSKIEDSVLEVKKQDSILKVKLYNDSLLRVKPNLDSILKSKKMSDSIVISRLQFDSLFKYKSLVDSILNNTFIKNESYSKINGNGIQSFQNSIVDSLIKTYLNLFDNIYRSDDFLLPAGVDTISTPVLKIKFLITYCLLSHILPTRSAIESCIRLNLCFLIQKDIIINYKIISPLAFKIKYNEIKEIVKYYYKKLDSLHEISINRHIDENGLNMSIKDNLFNTAMVEKGFLEKEIPVNPNKWKIAFCINDVNGKEIKNAFSVFYHSYNLEPNKVDNASLAFAELPPGEIYLAVSANNSNKNSKIKENSIYVKEEINNASLDPFRRVIQYDINKALSRKNIFIIFIHLLK